MLTTTLCNEQKGRRFEIQTRYITLVGVMDRGQCAIKVTGMNREWCATVLQKHKKKTIITKSNSTQARRHNGNEYFYLEVLWSYWSGYSRQVSAASS